ncbi:hypothetical protein, partial [Azovibrio restrictus]|uniref:hypothetical protein n=1 Tax=Azovibrio restrictus TaxID=146938 RepID=UPI00146FA5FC
FGYRSDGYDGVLPLVITPTLVGIETVNLAVTGVERAETILNLQDASGLKAVSLNNAIEPVGGYIVNLGSIVQPVNTVVVSNILKALESMSVSGTQSGYPAVQFSYAAGALVGENSVTLNLDGASLYSLSIGRDTSGSGPFYEVGLEGYEHLTINVNRASSIGFLNLPMDSGSAGSITITGGADLQLGVLMLGDQQPVYPDYSGIYQTDGRLASIDASALTGNLTLVLSNIMDVGKAGSSSVEQDVTVTGGSGDDTFVLHDVMQAGDRVLGGGGTDTLQFCSGSGLNSVAESIEVAALRAMDIFGVFGEDFSVIVDFSYLASVDRIELSNATPTATLGYREAGFDQPSVNFTMTSLRVGQAASITIQHASTGNCDIADSVIQAALATDTASDTLGVTIADGKNLDFRFNFTIDTAFASSGASSFEHLTITDTDAESNAVELNDFAQFTGSITLKGGKAGTFLNFDVDTDGADVTQQRYLGHGDSVANPWDALDLVGNYHPVQQGLLGLATDGSAIDFAAGHIHDVGNLATQVRLGAASINAAATD